MVGSGSPSQLTDDPPAHRLRRELLNAATKEHYPHLCTSAFAIVLKRRRGWKHQQIADLAEEVVQEALTRALGKAAEFDPSKRPVPWLMRFILNVIKESEREHRREPRQSDLGDAHWNQILEACCDRVPSSMLNEKLAWLDKAMAKVTPEQRQIITLRFMKGIGGEDLARAVGAPSAGAVRVRLFRALEALHGAIPPSIQQEEKP